MWQQQQPEIDLTAAQTTTPDVATQLLQQLREKDEQLQLLRKTAAMAATAVNEVEMIEEAPEVARLKEELRRKDGAAREMKRKLDEADEAMKEREMQEKLEVMERRMQARMKQQQQELEARFGSVRTGAGLAAAAASPVARSEASPRSTVSTSGYAVRSAVTNTPWADLEAREEQQQQEAKEKEAEMQQLRAAARAKEQENELMKEKIRMLEALMPAPKPTASGIFTAATDTAEEQERLDEELIATRTSELEAWAEEQDGTDKKAEWQGLCMLHKVKKLGADWPKTPAARKRWCKRVATAEVRLTDVE
jgi:hypothetical protein